MTGPVSEGTGKSRDVGMHEKRVEPGHRQSMSPPISAHRRMPPAIDATLV
jgi:hypothetical protein